MFIMIYKRLKLKFEANNYINRNLGIYYIKNVSRETKIMSFIINIRVLPFYDKLKEQQYGYFKFGIFVRRDFIVWY